MIFKIQKSLSSSNSKPQVLIYNRNRTYTFQDNISKDIQDLMGEKLKIYVNAHIKNGVIMIDSKTYNRNF